MLKARQRTSGSDSGSGAPGALVIGGDYRALSVARSLGRRNVPVWILIDRNFHPLAGASRYVLRSKPWPGDQSELRQVRYLLELAGRHRLRSWTLFPTTDEHAVMLARHQSELSATFRMVTSPLQVVRRAYDKRLAYQLAEELGVEHPRTWYPGSREELERLDCDFPVILKPAFKDVQNSFTWEKAWKVSGRDELLARYDQAAQLIDPQLIMVQELIPGDGTNQFSYGVLALDGEPHGVVVACRRRQYPNEFGRSSSYVETIEQPEVEDAGRRLLAALRYTGLMEIEFKRDPRDGRPKVLDLNPRIWWWNSLSWRAGVDFPHLFWRLSRGESIPQLKTEPGVRWIKMVTDLPAAFEQLRRGRLSPGTYLRSFRRPLEFAVFTRDDPMPALAEIPLFFVSKWKQRMRFRARDRAGVPAELEKDV
jgi:D-aspartate ligase